MTPNPFMTSPCVWLSITIAVQRRAGADLGGVALSGVMLSALAVDAESTGALAVAAEGGEDTFRGLPLVVVPADVLVDGVPELMSPEETELTRQMVADRPGIEVLDAMLEQAVLSAPDAAAPYGIDVVVSPALPMVPDDRTRMTRFVRHGFAEILEWLGEDVGPEPDETTHAFVVGGRLFVSAALHARMVDRGVRVG